MKLTKRVQKRCFVPNDPDKASLTIQYLYPNEIRKVEAEVNSVVYEKSEAEQGITKIGINPYNRSLRMAEAAVVGWNGFFDQFGKPIPFKKKHLSTIARFTINTEEGQKDLLEWIDEQIQAHNAEVEEKSEDSSEN